jgi:hypothetical protein
MVATERHRRTLDRHLAVRACPRSRCPSRALAALDALEPARVPARLETDVFRQVRGRGRRCGRDGMDAPQWLRRGVPAIAATAVVALAVVGVRSSEVATPDTHEDGSRQAAARDRARGAGDRQGRGAVARVEGARRSIRRRSWRRVRSLHRRVRELEGRCSTSTRRRGGLGRRGGAVAGQLMRRALCMAAVLAVRCRDAASTLVARSRPRACCAWRNYQRFETLPPDRRQHLEITSASARCRPTSRTACGKLRRQAGDQRQQFQRKYQRWRERQR